MEERKVSFPQMVLEQLESFMDKNGYSPLYKKYFKMDHKSQCKI